MKYDIESTPQDIEPTGSANGIIVAMTKRMLEAQKLEKSIWTKVVANAIYTLS